MKTKDEQELRNLLSVEPAPGFQARVRERIDREREPRRWSFPGVFAAAGVAAAVVAAVFVFVPRGGKVQQPPARTEVAGTASPQETVPVISASVPAESRWPHRRAAKAARPEPQLIIAANEASALRRLLSGEVNVLPARFEPQIREFQIPEAAVEPLAPPAPITIEPLEAPQPAFQDIRR